MIGPGEALRQALLHAKGPSWLLTGEELHSATLEELSTTIDGLQTVAFGGTGFSHLSTSLIKRHAGLVVVDPLDVALAAALAAIEGGSTG